MPLEELFLGLSCSTIRQSRFNQGGRRAGAVTIGLDIWHLDVPEFLEMQAENGDRRRKAYDVFPQLVIADEFMRRVQHSETWTLVDPYEVKEKLGIDLAQQWGKGFETAYAQIEAELGQKIQLYKTVKCPRIIQTHYAESGRDGNALSSL